MNLFMELLLLLPIIIYSYIEAFVKLFIPVKRKSVSGELVLITGAGHGIGRVTAYEFANRQSRLVLWDINKHGIEETAAECRRLGATAHAFVVDCSKKEEIYSAAEKTTKAFLPAMMNNNHGHIVTVASAAGHLATSFMVTYSSSKFAAVGFHKALTQELSALGKDGIKTSCLCPVFTNTGFVKNPSIRFMKVLEPEKVANKLLEGILTNQKMIFVPSFLKIHLILEKILPEHAMAAVYKLQNIQFDAVVGYRNRVISD
ncbi:17-beta-hydroxysteroid dehydrogenase 13-like isoform X2 [Terrapene carolina triunguis]|uniref:Estradiol 17-beta-dehydrogenase 11 n=1 Tax=Terrapene triunguis TaxID=2587831 RepID=A0A674I5R0_9SAUR|nr:17-beta-hydroxysteroid dehydrogenase 13-like isoform X2 [Terrapene carolina triunguis]